MNKSKDLDTGWKNHLMVLCAFRYCIRRRTYISTLECTTWLREMWKELDDDIKKRIVVETTAALDNNKADVADPYAWRSLLEHITKGATHIEQPHPPT